MEQLNFASVKDTDKVYRILGDLSMQTGNSRS